MKNTILLSVLLFVTTAQAQSVLRVNNIPGINVPYTTLAAAITAAGPSDIIMVEGSIVNYGSVTIAKKVTIVGPGYFLTVNIDLQANVQPATINTITLNAGADGSSLSGLLAGNFGLNNVNNISISNCNLSSGILLSGTGNNVSIRGNFLPATNISSTGSYTGVVVANNLIANMSINATSSFTIMNNTIGGGPGAINNSDFRNNICLWTTGVVSITGSIIKNNVFLAASQAGADATNFFNATVAALFVGPVGNSSDSPWKLKAGSPAIGFGESGVDCGMYGGNTPYSLSGIASGQPTITNFSTPATVGQNGTLNVKVSAKVN